MHALGGARYAARFMQRGKSTQMSKFKHDYEQDSLYFYNISFDS
jgi:hypothetical protein